MIISAKFASVCPCCSVRITPGSRVEWIKGSKAVHVACAGKPAPIALAATSVRRSSYAGRTSYARGKWNGCSCGARELPEGGLSANACASCKFDEYDM